MKYVLQVWSHDLFWYADYEGETLEEVLHYWDDNKADYVGCTLRIVSIETTVTVLVDALIGVV
jgi:hypothetical protein